MRNVLAVLGGALLLLWPAFLNGYPIVFSDTGGFLEQALLPDGGWDKPWIYGPFLTPLHGRLSLWPAAAAQAAILSFLLWLLPLGLGRPTAGPPLRHLGLCAVLAATTAAPWFAATLMPDILASVAVLALFLLASRRLSRPAFVLVAALATVAVASHLAHLPLAAAAILLLGLADGWRPWRPFRHLPWRPALPLFAALLLLLGTNAAWHGRPSISPYGSIFALARLVANGSAATVIRRECPAVGWHVCAWTDRLPTDSDDFLWRADGPVWADGRGPLPFPPEAAAIVRETLRTEPVAVLRDAARDTLAQLGMVKIGDTLVPDHLGVAVLPRLQLFFGPDEAARFLRGEQARGRLPALAAPLNDLHVPVLLAGLAGTILLALRGGGGTVRLAALVLAALLVNAAVTGALSHPHHRYQARLAWLLVLVPVVGFSGMRGRPPAVGASPLNPTVVAEGPGPRGSVPAEGTRARSSSDGDG